MLLVPPPARENYKKTTEFGSRDSESLRHHKRDGSWGFDEGLMMASRDCAPGEPATGRKIVQGLITANNKMHKE